VDLGVGGLWAEVLPVFTVVSPVSLTAPVAMDLLC
jgi:hypothetical protein